VKRNIWLARRQCRYPGIPQYAVKYKTPMIRMKRLSVFSKKEMPVFPRPWIMLMSALLAYKNGHIQERVRMNSPARELWKSSLPNAGASRKNPARHPVPRKMQPQRELRIIFFMRCTFF
jgi:hypothetical protein